MGNGRGGEGMEEWKIMDLPPSWDDTIGFPAVAIGRPTGPEQIRGRIMTGAKARPASQSRPSYVPSYQVPIFVSCLI